MKRLYVSDLDGTLLGADSRLSRVTELTLSDLVERGALITVATARTPATVAPLLAGTHLSLPAIVFTGAALFDISTHRFSSVRYMTPATAEAIAEEFRAVGISAFCYAINPADSIIDAYFPSRQPDDNARRFIDQRLHLPLKRMHVGISLPAALTDRVVLFFATGPTLKLQPMADRLRQRDDCWLVFYPDIFDPSVSMLEIFAAGVSKASAVRHLAAEVGADSVMVFGDNLNDLSMMSVADWPVAVENAEPAVRDAARVVIGPNTESSVARFIAKDFAALQAT